MANLSTGQAVRILFFDSGMGGLSIFRQVKALNPEIESYYLFDNACFPYGEKSESFIINRVDSLLEQAASEFNPSLIVVACNTASTIALPELRARIQREIVGVVPAIKPAALKSPRRIIGLLATPGTIHRAYTDALIQRFASDCRVLKIGTTVLVREAEKVMSGGKADSGAIAHELKPWLDLPLEDQPDTVILGCTHFPHLRPYLQKLLPHCTLIDSGEAIGRRVRALIALRPIPKVKVNELRNRAFYTGDHLSPGYAAVFKRSGFDSLEHFPAD